MKWLRRRGTIPMVVIGAIALLSQIVNRNADQIYEATAQTSIPNSEVWTVKEGSVYDGDTLRVIRGNQELKIRFCGIDAPEKDQPLGVASRDHLRSLIAQGDGTVMLVPIEEDRYGRTVAELSVLTSAGEIHLNSQMVMDGMAYHYAQYSDSCPNKGAIAQAEQKAKAQGVGVWGNATAIAPWEWRKQ